MSTVLGVVQVFLCVVLVFLILMHSGKDSGLSGAFGVGTGAGPFGGGSLVERNLNRWTIGFAVAFVCTPVTLIKIWYLGLGPGFAWRLWGRFRRPSVPGSRAPTTRVARAACDPVL